MAKTWLERMGDGHFEAELVRLHFESGGGLKCEGQGKLVWNRDTRARLEALTDGGRYLAEHPFTPGTEPGKVLPDDYYMEVTGQTADGSELNIERVGTEGFHVRSWHETAVWRIDESDINSQVILTKRDKTATKAQTQFLLAPIKCDRWPRTSKLSYDNPRFGWMHGKLDWLEFPTSIGTVAACQWRDDVLRVAILQAQHEGDREHEINAVRMAFNFLCGRMANVLASETSSDGQIVRRLRFPFARHRDYSLSPPLGWPSHLSEHFETLLSRAVNYFVTEKGSEIANYLFACQDSRDNSVSTHAMVLCSTLEALVRELRSDVEKPDTLTPHQSKRLGAYLKDELGLDAKLVHRINGLLSMLEQKPPQATMREWVQSGFLNIDKADADAWQELRNPVMHGELLLWRDTGEVQKQLDAIGRVTNLLNKLLLHLIGYEGKYHDCVVYRDRPFPPNCGDTTSDY